MILVTNLFYFEQAWILKGILTFTADETQPLEMGLFLAFLAFMAQLTRNLTFNGLWMIGIHTGNIRNYCTRHD